MFEDTIAQLEPESSTVDQRHTVLIVDDDADQSEVLSHRLRKQGFETLAARTGAEGLRLARSERPGLVLLDLRLPDINGFEICEQLADDSRTCSIPVIFLSGMERADVVRRARSAGGQFYVRKPYDPNALLILIQTAIDEAESW